MDKKNIIWQHQENYNNWEIWTNEMNGKYTFEVRREGTDNPLSIYHSNDTYNKLKIATDAAKNLIDVIEDPSSIGF